MDAAALRTGVAARSLQVSVKHQPGSTVAMVPWRVSVARKARREGALQSSLFSPKPAAAKDARPTKVQELMYVYEINGRDRESPAYLRLSAKQTENALGDLVPFTNKVYNGSLDKRLGVAGICLLIQHVPKRWGLGDQGVGR